MAAASVPAVRPPAARPEEARVVPRTLAVIPPPPVGGFELGPLDVRLYGVLIALGAYLALTWTVRRYAAAGGDATLAERAGIAALLGGFLGARIGYVLPRLDDFLDRPQDILAIWQGGLTFFGGLTGGTLAVLVVVSRGGGDIARFADAIAPALPLAQAIGRWGNFFNQELYGRPTDLPWALAVEAPYRRRDFADAETFHPTFLYESLWNTALVLALLRLERRGRLPRGGLMLAYLIGYGIGRAWIETLRIDTVERYAGLSRNNWIALAVALAGLAALQRLRARDGSGPATDHRDDAATEAAADDGATDDPTTGDTGPA
ncbi:MAG: prolipoprotein diacylglyceryl transferase [Actinomycetota bacterium]